MSYVRKLRRSADRAAGVMFEQVESRLLFHFSVVNPIADFSVAPGTPSSTVDISSVINSDEITGTVVRFDTSLGDIDLSLHDALPISVARTKPIRIPLLFPRP